MVFVGHTELIIPARFAYFLHTAYVDELQRTLHGVVPTNLHERWKRA